MTDKDCSDTDSGFPCEDSQCCAPSVEPSHRRWRTGVFVIVVLLAFAVTGYSLLWRDTDAGETAACCPPEAACAPGCATATADTPLLQKLSALNFALIVLSGTNEPIDAEATETIAAAVEQINADGVRAGALVLRRDDPAFSEAVERFGVTTFPTAIAVGPGGYTFLAANGITVTAIEDAYRRNSAVSSVDTLMGENGPQEH